MVELVNLNEDITLTILLCCDVFSILKMEQTCRYLRKVSLYRHLWLTLATNLDYDHAPNLLPHESLESFSTDRLREMVIRSTRSYLNWTRPEGPKPTRSIAFKIPVRSIHLVKLLPGGKYLVVIDFHGRFHCYDTDSQEQIVSYTGASSRDAVVPRMDCLLVDGGNTLVLSYVSARRADSQTLVTVVRIDIRLGASEIARTFTFAEDNFELVNDIVIAREVVVIQKNTKILVGNWRTGEARMIVYESNTITRSIFIIHNHLCVVEEIPGDGLIFSAVVLSDIFWNRSGCESGQNSASTPNTSVRSQDVFQDSHRVTILDTSNGTSQPYYIESVSVCTSSWKTPSLCEHDAPATPTRILFFVRPNSYEYMAFELLFSPASTNPLNRPSVLSYADDAPQNGCLLTCRQRSLAHSYNRRDMHICYLTSATRTGRLFAAHLPSRVLDNSTYVTAINMLNPLEETLSDRSTTSIPNELFERQAALTSPMNRLLNGVSVNQGIDVEPYSCAMWYRSGSTLFIHHTD